MQKVERNSNIEILRIISIFLIVLSHCVYHGGGCESENIVVKIFSMFIAPFGKLFFCVFAVISCWFLIDSNFKSKRFISLWLQTLLFNLVLLCIEIFAFKHSVPTISIFKSFFPMLGFGITHGYIAGYLLFLLVIPMLKVVIKKSNSKVFIAIAILISGMNVVLAVVIPSNLLTELAYFIELFFIIAIAKKYHIIELIGRFKKFSMLCVILCYFLSVGLYSFKYFNAETIIVKLVFRVLVADERSIINIIFGIFLFGITNSFTPLYHKTINFVSPCTLDILLLHDSGIIRHTVWNDIFKSYKYVNNDVYILWVFIVAIIIVISGFIVYNIRIILFNKLCNNKLVNILFIKIDKKMNLEENDSTTKIENNE